MKNLLTSGLGIVVFLAGCSRSNTLVLGPVEAMVGGHTVVVTDCYRISAPQPEKLDDATLASGRAGMRSCSFAPMSFWSMENPTGA